MASVTWRFILSACLFALLTLLPVSVDARGDLYCGMKNCYEILSVPSTATDREVKKAFYKLSLQYHPDKNPSADVVELYREITTAYEVLADPESRKGYDDALEHPEQFLRNQYRYYQHQYRHAQKIDAWKIILITLILASLCHWYYWQHRHAKLKTLIASAPLVVQRMRAKVKADLIEAKARQGIKNPTVTKGDIDAGVLLEDVSHYAELTSWEGRPPTWRDALPIWLTLLPFRFAQWAYWHARFIVLFTILGREYGEEEASYATSQALGMDYNKSQHTHTRQLVRPNHDLNHLTTTSALFLILSFPDSLSLSLCPLSQVVGCCAC